MERKKGGDTLVSIEAGDMEYTPLPSAHFSLAALLLSSSRALALGRCWPGPPHTLKKLTPSPQSGHLLWLASHSRSSHDDRVARSLRATHRANVSVSSS